MSLPKWFFEKTSSDHTKTKTNTHYIDRTLYKISKLMEEVIFSNEYSKKNGFLQSIDVKFKLLAILFLIVITSFLRSLKLILMIYFLTLFIAWLSQIELKFFIKRVWLFIPFFSSIIALPMIFNFITPGEPVIRLIEFNHVIYFLGLQFSEISITLPGLAGFVIFVFRVATSVSLVILLTLSTPWNVLMNSLRRLHVPKEFVLILSISCQYILILVRLAQDMYFAKKTRVLKTTDYGKERNWVASRIGVVLMKSRAMSEETYSAMISRGFQGEWKVL